LDAVGENLIERAFARTNIGPWPILHTQEWMERTEEYVRSGEPFELHATLPSDEWPLYQRGMRAMATPLASEFARRLRVPKPPTTMLEIGGSPGYHSVLLGRRHRELQAIVLDLREAVEHAAPLLAAEGMGDRVVHRAGNALTDDLGEEKYDIVIAAQLVHHFSEEGESDTGRSRRGRTEARRHLRDHRRVPADEPERRRPDRGVAGLLLRPDESIGHVDPGGDGRLAAARWDAPETSDAVPQRTRCGSQVAANPS
jgi:hypothetical protein